MCSVRHYRRDANHLRHPRTLLLFLDHLHLLEQDAQLTANAKKHSAPNAVGTVSIVSRGSLQEQSESRQSLVELLFPVSRLWL